MAKSKGSGKRTPKAGASKPRAKKPPAKALDFGIVQVLKPGRQGIIAAQIERNKEQQRRAKDSIKRLKDSEKRLRESLELTEAESRRNLQQLARFVITDKKKRRYVDRQTGEEISRREYLRRTTGQSPEAKARDNLLAQARGRSTAEGREKLRKRVDRQGRLKAFGDAYKEQKARELGVRPQDIKIRGESDTAREFKQLSRQVEKDRGPVRNGTANKSQRTRYVDSLILLGIIDVNKREEWLRFYTAQKT